MISFVAVGGEFGASNISCVGLHAFRGRGKAHIAGPRGTYHRDDGVWYHR